MNAIRYAKWISPRRIRRKIRQHQNDIDAIWEVVTGLQKRIEQLERIITDRTADS